MGVFTLYDIVGEFVNRQDKTRFLQDDRTTEDGDDPVKILETERLTLRRLSTDDAEFIVELLNGEPFIRNIGDKGVRTVADAFSYILSGPVASYQRYGFGLYLVELKETGASIGICGLIKRDTLEDVDIGFAFLPAYWGKGYAVESAFAVKTYADRVIGLNRIVAITLPDNRQSIRTLEKIGLRFEKTVRLAGDDRELNLMAVDFGN